MAEDKAHVEKAKDEAKKVSAEGEEVEEEEEADIVEARRRREANEKFFKRVEEGVVDVVGKLEGLRRRWPRLRRRVGSFGMRRIVWIRAVLLLELHGARFNIRALMPGCCREGCYLPLGTLVEILSRNGLMVVG